MYPFGRLREEAGKGGMKKKKRRGEGRAHPRAQKIGKVPCGRHAEKILKRV